MHVFKHPKYYKELRTRNKSDQGTIETLTKAVDSTRPGLTETQASSGKRQAPSRKHQAPSRKRQAP